MALTIALFIVCPYYGWRLKVGDMTPGAALLFPDHPYNIAYAKLNEKFVGANQLVVIADTGKPDGMKDVAPLNTMEEFADHMESVGGRRRLGDGRRHLEAALAALPRGRAEVGLRPRPAEVHRRAVLPVHADLVARATSIASCHRTCATGR